MSQYGFAAGLSGINPIAADYFPRAYDVTISPAAVAANTSAEQTFTVTGLSTNDAVFVTKPTAQAGIGIVGTRVSAADTLAITFGNFTAGGITPTASQLYKIVAVKVA